MFIIKRRIGFLEPSNFKTFLLVHSFFRKIQSHRWVVLKTETVENHCGSKESPTDSRNVDWYKDFSAQI